MRQLSPLEDRIAAWLARHEAAMVDFLGRLVNIDSPSRDKAAVDRVGTEIEAFLSSHGIACTTTEMAQAGNILTAEVGERAGDGGHLLILGHRDTVFPAGEAERRPFAIKDKRAYGPGVADMKGGLVVNAFALAAIKACAVPARPIVALFTSDEEITSPASRISIERAAKGAHAVFNSEPGRPNGNIVTGRKGGIFMRVDVHGRAAHSGSNFAHGISAIEELSRKVLALHALSDIEAGITVNVGIVGGGQSINTVAPHAFGEFDVRYVSSGDREGILARVSEIVGTNSVEGLRAELTQTGEFLPLEERAGSRAMFGVYRDVAKLLGHDVDGEFSGGCADSGFACQQGAPALDGLGPIGGHSHTVDEYIELDSLLGRAQILALSLMRIAASDLASDQA